MCFIFNQCDLYLSGSVLEFMQRKHRTKSNLITILLISIRTFSLCVKTKSACSGVARIVEKKCVCLFPQLVSSLKIRAWTSYDNLDHFCFSLFPKIDWVVDQKWKKLVCFQRILIVWHNLNVAFSVSSVICLLILYWCFVCTNSFVMNLRTWQMVFFNSAWNLFRNE